MGLFPVEEKINFIILSSRDGPKKGTWFLDCSTLTDNDVLQEETPLKLFFFPPESEQVCVYSLIHTQLMIMFRVERTVTTPLFTVICIQNEFFNYIR